MNELENYNVFEEFESLGRIKHIYYYINKVKEEEEEEEEILWDEPGDDDFDLSVFLDCFVMIDCIDL